MLGVYQSPIQSAAITTGSPTFASATPSLDKSVANVIYCNAGGGAFATSLPNPTGLDGKTFKFVKVDGSLNAVTITSSLGGTIFNSIGALSPTLNTPGETWDITVNGPNYFVTSHLANSEIFGPYTNPAIIAGWDAPSLVSLFSHRVGKNLLYYGGFKGSNGPTGGPGAIALEFNNIGLTLSGSLADGVPVGTWGNRNGGGSVGGFLIAQVSSSTGLIYLADKNAANIVVPLATSPGSTGGNNSLYTFTASIPISGWLA